MRGSEIGSRVVLALVLGFLGVLGVAASGGGVHATGPCDEVMTDPNPPSGEPEPLISGTVVNAATAAGVPGATVRLFKCTQYGAVQMAMTTTSNTGAFSFANPSGPAWDYVSVDLSGPLAGMQPANGTANPTAIIEVGEGVTGLSLLFQ